MPRRGTSLDGDGEGGKLGEDPEKGVVNADTSNITSDEALDDYERKYGHKAGQGADPIDWGLIATDAGLGALLGGCFATFFWNKDERSKTLFMWGIFVGGLGAGFLVFLFLLYKQMQQEMANGENKELAEKRAALRRQEMMRLQAHQEFVYYDASTAQSTFFKLLCCPHYGKITSERVIYSEKVLFPKFSCSCEYLKKVVAYPWAKKVHSMDVEHVTDVTVEQSCTEYLSNSGTILLSVNGAADASAVDGARTRLLEAMEARELKPLLSAISACTVRGVPVQELGEEVSSAKALAQEIAKEDGEDLSKIYVNPGAGKLNNLTHLHVFSVTNPYGVLDDLSYKLHKDEESAGWSAARMVDTASSRLGNFKEGIKGKLAGVKFGP